MTVVAWKDGWVAADSLVTQGDNICQMTNKVVTHRGKIYASVGINALFIPMITWHINGADPRDIPPISGDDRYNKLIVFEGYDIGPITYTHDLPYGYRYGPTYASGSGSEYALGAMHAGATAIEAAGIACRCSSNCGGPVHAIDLKEYFTSGRAEEERKSPYLYNVCGKILEKLEFDIF